MPSQDINQASEALKSHLNGGRERLSKAISDALGDTMEMLEKQGHQMKKQSLHARDSVDKYVKLNPFKSLSMALVAGAIVALILRR